MTHSYSTNPQSQPQLTRYYVQMAKPTLTRILIGLNILVFIGMFGFGIYLYLLNGTGGTSFNQIATTLSSLISLLMGSKYPETDYTLLVMGAKYNPLILDGQVWRLFTAMFLHIGIIHLLFNLFALNFLGPMVEGYFGHWRYAVIYLIGGLFGSLASYAFSPAPSAGASGAVFGLAGATTVYFLRYRNNFGERGQSMLQSMFAIIGINLVFGFATSGIDNWGHIGGLVGGALVAYGFMPTYEQPAVTASAGLINDGSTSPQPLSEKRNMPWELAWTAIVVVAVWGVLQLANQVTPL